jgi:putative glutamine amidotransferase
MPNVASWIRECDEPHFRHFFEKRPDMRLFNARIAPMDWAAMDGLLLTGGEDIGAEYLRQEIPPLSLIHEPQPARDAWEFATLLLALQSGKPVLAICKGHQVLNVVLGGTLHPDIPGHNLPEMKTNNIQPLRYDFSAPAGRRFDRVNSSHHQAIDRLGDGLEVEAWCAADDVIEQVKLSGRPFVLGVQYHPERDELYEPLFACFFDHLSS